MIGDRSDEIPDLAEPIEAWRCWQLKGDDKTPILYSPATAVVWPPVAGWDGNVIRDDGRNFITAVCQDAWGDPALRKPHECPSADKGGHGGMGCGIYAFKSLGDLAWDFPIWGLPNWPKPGHPWNQLVWGKVLLWGKVYEHERGYRAEFARVHQLVHVPTIGVITPEEIQRVADFYGVEFIPFGPERIEEIQTYLKARPSTPPSSIPPLSPLLSVSTLAALVWLFGVIGGFLVDKMNELADKSRAASLAMKDLADAAREDPQDG